MHALYDVYSLFHNAWYYATVSCWATAKKRCCWALNVALGQPPKCKAYTLNPNYCVCVCVCAVSHCVCVLRVCVSLCVHVCEYCFCFSFFLDPSWPGVRVHVCEYVLFLFVCVTVCVLYVHVCVFVCVCHVCVCVYCVCVHQYSNCVCMYIIG